MPEEIKEGDTVFYLAFARKGEMIDSEGKPIGFKVVKISFNGQCLLWEEGASVPISRDLVISKKAAKKLAVDALKKKIGEIELEIRKVEKA